MFSRTRDPDTGQIDEKPKHLSHLTSWRSFTAKITSDSPTSRDWIKGVVICSWIIGSVLTLNIIFTIIAAGIAYSKNGETDFDFASLYMGKCSVAKNWTTGLHLVINILSTAMLGASNYCMQCLASPSRAQVDEAHQKRTWVKIGIPNLWNLLRWQRGKRQLLGWMLFITSLPIHLIFNSAVLFSLAPMEYTVLLGQPGQVSGNTSTEFDRCFPNGAGVDLATFNAATSDDQFKTLSKQQCIDTFAQDYVSGHRMLILVTNASMPEDEPVAQIGSGNNKDFNVKSTSAYEWICDYDYECNQKRAQGMVDDWSVRGYKWWYPIISLRVPTGDGYNVENGSWAYRHSDSAGNGIFETPDHERLSDFLEEHPSEDEVQAELDDSSGWVNSSFPRDVTILGSKSYCGGAPQRTGSQQTGQLLQTYPVDHCLALSSGETCQLLFSPAICIIVIGCNIIKLICALFTARDAREDVFLTIGDAIASFLTRPDPTTEGACLLSKPLVDKRAQGWQRSRGKKHKELDLQIDQQKLPLPLLPRKRWFQAASTARWICTVLTFVCMLIPAIYVLRLGIQDFKRAFGDKTLWEGGLGDPTSGAILSGMDMEATANGIFSMVLLANSPQLLVSIAYFMYNGLLTCMLGAVEYDNYARDRKPLRVSWPRGEQRSTYYLSLPYRYSLPLLAVSAALHWLVSQSLFFVEIIPYDQNGERDNGNEVVTCGYSPIAIILAIAVASCLLLASILLGLRRFRSQMPLAAQCSAAISAACHPATPSGNGDVDHAVNPVQWGEVPGIYTSPSPLTFSNRVDGDLRSSREADSGTGSGSDDQRQMLVGTSLDDMIDLTWSGAVESGFYHCSFTSEDVFEPRRGRVYI
ncbi:hypothetical protein BDV12DRAFT_158142 [Aspergillus spectabilis]